MVEPIRGRRVTRRDVLRWGGGVAAAALGAPLLVDACGSGPSGGGGGGITGTTVISTGTKSPNATEITFWSEWGADALVALTETVRKFNRGNRDVFVKLVAVPTSSVTDISKLLTAVRGGTGPDVFMIDRFTVAQYASVGVIQDLSGFVDKEPGLAGQYLDFAWKENLFKSKPYAIPFDTDARALFFRHDMLQEAGFDPAELDPGNGPVTLDRIRQMSDRISQKDSRGNYTKVGFVPWIDQGFHYTWGFDFGGKFADLGACGVTPTDPGVVDAFQFMYDWAKAMEAAKLQSFISAYLAPSAPPQQHPFITKRLAMHVDVNFEAVLLKKYAPQVRYGITYIPVPSPGGKPSSWSGGFGCAMPRGARNTDAVWKFIRWLGGREGQAAFVPASNGLPTWKALFGDDSIFIPSDQFFLKHLLPISTSRPSLPVGALYWDQLTTAQQKVTLNQAQARPALEEVASRVNAQLKQYCPL